jgi:DNA-binding CsgD family transcriptional regulator
MGLPGTDLLRVLTLADDLLAVRHSDDLHDTLLGGVASIVGADTATLTHLDIGTGHEVAVLWPAHRPMQAVLAAYPRLGHLHPLRRPVAEAARQRHRRMPVRISDVLSARAWRSDPLRTEALPHVTDQMAVPVRRRGRVLHAVTLGRSTGVFTDRQRDLLLHVSAHVRAAAIRVDPRSGRGLQLAPIPEPVSLIAAPGLGPGGPAGGPDALSSLSRRERQVLTLVAEGLTDAQVARRLDIRPATVSRHLHRVYTRYGVANRAAAVRLLAPSAPG